MSETKAKNTENRQFNESEIDNILDEIEENEKKQNIEKNDIEWNDVLDKIRNKDIHSIKTMISCKMLNVNTQNPSNGKTILIYAVIIGDMDLVRTICNFGGDVKIKDDQGLDALDYAIKYGRYKITELVYYRQLSGSLGNDLKRISMEIHAKNKQSQYIYSQSKDLASKITDFMISAIKERAPFDPVMFHYSWFFELHKNGKNVFDSDLWKTMMSVYEEILSNTKDKNGWKWLKQQFINSLIWYMPHPTHMHDDDDDNKMESVLKKTLFYELFKRVRHETKVQSNVLLKTEIDSIKSNKPNEWKQLITYNVTTNHSANARQDVCRCLTPKYNEHDLSEDMYPPSTHFSAKKHYDTNIYLNELMFRANIMNDLFQNDMKRMTEDINHETGDTVTFRMGPVKTLSRSQNKVENDYINEAYPTSAKILDINRCALQFNSIPSMMQFIEIFTKKVRNKACRSITEIIRCKNGWSVYDAQYPQYTDIKLNVLVLNKHHSIIAEIQFLLSLMSSYKKVAHKLYSVERKFELVYNHQLLKDEMDEFKDIEDENGVWRQMVMDDDINSFRELWENNIINMEILRMKTNETSNNTSRSNHLVFTIMISETGKINDYLSMKSKDKEMYRDAALYFFNDINDWNVFFFDDNTIKNNKHLFIQRLIALFDNDETLTDFVFNKQSKLNGLSLFQTLCEYQDITFLKYVLFDERISGVNICKSLTQLFASNVPPHFDKTLQTLKNETKDKIEGILHKLSVIFRLCTHRMIVQQKAFNCFTICALLDDSMEFKVTEDIHVSSGDCVVHSFGHGNYGKLALGDKYCGYDASCPTPRVSPYYKMIKIASSSDHCLGMDVFGYVYSWGRNKDGQLGLGDQRERYTPQRLEEWTPCKALDVAVGSVHSLVLMKDGTVWSFGVTYNGRLGHGYHQKTTIYNTPKRIEKLNHIVHIACGSDHSCVVSKNGDLFSFGWNHQGQLGSGRSRSDFEQYPKKIDLEDVVSAVECGSSHTLILTASHKVLSCGYGASGALGYSCYNYYKPDEKCQFTPKMIKTLETKNTVHIAAGTMKSLCVTEEGILYTFGHGGNGDLGHGDNENQIQPKQVEWFKKNNIKIRACEGGLSHSGVISTNDEVYLWGNGERGELGQGANDLNNKAIPTKVETFTNMEIKALSLGSGHCLVLQQEFEEKKDANEKEKEWILKGGHEINIKNKMNNYAQNQYFNVFVKNPVLFGDSGWIFMGTNRKYSTSYLYTTSFIDSLQIMNNDNVIGLVDCHQIHELYHSEILNANYLILQNEDKTEIKKEDIYNDTNKYKLYDFNDKHLQDIQFKIESNETKKEFKVSVYVQPQKEINFFLLKTFSIKE